VLQSKEAYRFGGTVEEKDLVTTTKANINIKKKKSTRLDKVSLHIRNLIDMKIKAKDHHSTPTASPSDYGYALKRLQWLVLSPHGRPLDQFRTVQELLYVARDAIRGHRSLFLDGGVLHRDVLPGNIPTTPHTAC
jgi:hypothetical protein